MIVDDYGRVVMTADEMIDLLYSGRELTDDILAQPGDEINRYNELCRINDKLDNLIPVATPKAITPEDDHSARQKTWFVPLAYADIDVWEVLERRCSTEAERQRLCEERVEFEKRDLAPLLRLMMYLVDEFRSRKIVWGVGRGSSVASYALYLIGITKINPMQYGLEIGEFLKD
jgi:DNA polymerase III alpha subunit